MRSNEERARKGCQAFTLVELLVVVAIIGMLLTILLPSLSHARIQAKAVKCQSNLRQILIAFQAYTIENQDHAPRAAGHELGGQAGRMDKDCTDWSPAVMFGGGLPASERLLNPYINHQYDVFSCPSDRGEPIFWIDNPLYPDSLCAYELYGSSYFYASGYNRAAGVMMPMGIAKFVGLEFCYEPYADHPLTNGESELTARFPFPFKKVVIGDLPIHRTMPTIGAHPDANWHRYEDDHVWTNAAFLDGHADMIRVFPFDIDECPEWEGVTTMPDTTNPYY